MNFPGKNGKSKKDIIRILSVFRESFFIAWEKFAKNLKTSILDTYETKNFYIHYTKTKMAETKTAAKAEPKAVKPVAAKAEPKTVKPVATKAAAPKKVNKEEMMQKHQQMVQFVQNLLGSMENDMKRIRLTLNQLAKFDPENPESVEHKDAEQSMGNQELKSYSEENAEVVEGKFDGYFMIGNDQKKYPVPLNYSSKTKLVPWDFLKLKILEDGKMIYKLIQPVERKHLRAVLSKTDDNKFIAITDDGKNYFLNQAAVTFFKGKSGDELYILINDKEEMSFAAIEAIIKK